jgi:co-chaperonin GroES (HSP10)
MSKLKGKPIYGRVVLQKKKIDNYKTKSGLITGTPKEHLETFGDVIAVGDKVQSVEPGDVVLYNNLAVKEFTLLGEDYLMAPEEAIYFILDESEYKQD